MDDAALMQMLQSQYPQYYALLQYDPQILDIFRQVASDPASWPQARIDAAIAATSWWQQTPATTRQLIALNAADPATARQKIGDTAFSIQQMASQLGINLSPEQLSGIAIHAVASGWNQQQIQASLFEFGVGTGESWRNPGMIGATIAQYNALADQYGVPVDLQTLNGWATNTLAGNQTKEGFEQYLRQQASNLYPALAPAIASGQTVAQYAAPYAQIAARELNINPNAVDWRDPKWMNLVVGTDDKGNQGVRSLDEALQQIRSDPRYGWDSSTTAKTLYSQLAQQIGQKFGVAA